MQLTVREMRVEEADLIVDYFHNSTPEHLETLGVDPTRLPTPEAWRDRYRREYTLPINQRATLLVIWLSNDRPIGFSTSDKIVYGDLPPSRDALGDRAVRQAPSRLYVCEIVKYQPLPVEDVE
jgi:hypothetical protein